LKKSPVLLGLVLAATVAFALDNPSQEREQARELFARLIAFNTARGQGQVPAMARYIAEQLRRAGFVDADLHILPFEDTASLVARYPGDGSGGRPVLLLAHMDVVPANPTDWERQPFELVEEDGYFFGRGTQDMKADIAALVSAFIRMKREGFVPDRDLVLVFTGDEETEQATVRDLLANHPELMAAEFALNGDGWSGVLDDHTGQPRLYYLQGAEKAYASFELTTRNPGGHSSEPRVDNAIYDLAKALLSVQNFHFPVMANDWTRGSLAASGKTTDGELGAAMRRFAANPEDTGAAARLEREPAYVGRTRTTCIATLIQGGHAENALPQSATATVNCRVFPGMTIREVGELLQAAVGDKVEVRLTSPEFDSVASPLRPDVVAAVSAAVHALYPDVEVVPDQPSFATDGSFLRAAGIPTYGASGLFIRPGESFAHGLDERIPVASFYNTVVYWYTLLTTLGSQGAAPAG
jgi:acetylornithine deacetylase/succinyl-diaminopimelate desuccinylase-like protein